MYLLFDIGGTNMRLAVSKNGKTFERSKIVPTPQNFNKGIPLINEVTLELAKGKKIKAAAGGVAGPFDRKNTKLVASPNLPGWVNKPLQKKLQTILKAPVFIENDTAVVGLGEATFGAGKGKGIVVYMTISTGIGGARIVDNNLDENAMGFEPGHQIINFQSKFHLKYGAPGDLESYASGSALQKRYKKMPSKITDKKIWKQVHQYLAYGLHNAIVFWSPDIIVLGGGLMNHTAIKISELQKNIKKTLKIFPKTPLIKKATLKDVGGLYGALCLLKQHGKIK